MCWAGDHTLEAIEAAVTEVASADADDWFVVTITDANFERYGITSGDLRRVMSGNAKVKTCVSFRFILGGPRRNREEPLPFEC